MQTKYIFDSKRSLKLFFVFIYIYLSILSTVVYSQYNAHSFKIKSWKPSVLYVFIFIIYFKQLIYCSISRKKIELNKRISDKRSIEAVVCVQSVCVCVCMCVCVSVHVCMFVCVCV